MFQPLDSYDACVVQNPAKLIRATAILLTSASASILSSLTIFSTMRSARGRNMVWASFSSCAEMAWTTELMCHHQNKQNMQRIWNKKNLHTPASPDSWPTRSNMDSWGQFYTRPFLPVEDEDEVTIVALSLHYIHTLACLYWDADPGLSPAASSCTPPHERKPWRGESDTPHWEEPFSQQLHTAWWPTQLWRTTTTCYLRYRTIRIRAGVKRVYSRRCISLYSMVRACSELSSVGSSEATSWANVKASSCFPVLCRPMAFRT